MTTLNGKGQKGHTSEKVDQQDTDFDLPTIDLSIFRKEKDKKSSSEISEFRDSFGEDRSPIADLVLSALNSLRQKKFTFWASSGLGVISLGFILSVIQAVLNNPTPEISKTKYQNDMFLSAVTPAILGGITPNTPPEEIISRLQAGIQKYEPVLNDSLSDNFRSLINLKANEFAKNAQAEELSGEFLATDPTGLIQLSECPKKVGRVRNCVLLRYALEGLQAYRSGMESQDLDLARRGSDRFLIALLALNPPRIEVDQVPQYDRTVEGMSEILKAFYTINQYLPPTAVKNGFGVNVRQNNNDLTRPSETLIEQNQPIEP